MRLAQTIHHQLPPLQLITIPLAVTNVKLANDENTSTFIAPIGKATCSMDMRQVIDPLMDEFEMGFDYLNGNRCGKRNLPLS